ncbi:MAG: sulfatase [SAR202 cluster bacterium]|nr:sulfatase [SAR202 cluster bacterium]
MQGNNILFIMADEHNYNCINQLGNDFIITPNIDSLVKEGTTFTSAYTPSPLCVPARASLATGTYVHTNKYWDGAHAYDARIPGWQHVLRDNNVNVTSIGKLHYKDRTIDTGFTETIEPMHLKDGLGDLFGLLREEMPPKDACKRLSEELGRGDCEYLEYDRLITNKAIEWIRKQKKREKPDSPWVLFVSFVSPHYPLIAPPDFYDLYNNANLPYDNYQNLSKNKLHSWVKGIRESWPYDDYMDEEKRKIAVQAYYGMCSFMDSNVGKLLTELKQCDIYDDTTIIYASDHGESLGNRGLWGKMTMYEDSASIPLIIKGPNFKKNQMCKTPVTLIDLYPTIFDILSLDHVASEANIDGESLRAIANKTYDKNRCVLSEYHGAGSYGGAFMLRMGDYKYIYYVGHQPEVFDIKSDPNEKRNLANDPSFRSLVDMLDNALRSIINPESVDEAARSDQKKMLKDVGGIDFVLNRGNYAGTPVGS